MVLLSVRPPLPSLHDLLPPHTVGLGFRKCSGRRRSFTFTSLSFSPGMAFGSYYQRERKIETQTGKFYTRIHHCHVFPPSAGRKPRAIVKFLGGAFVGAVPEVAYSHFLKLLAREGFLVISVPYNVTFNHKLAAREVYDKFHICMDMIMASGLPYARISPSELMNLPLYSVGHSNGALLQLLVGSYFSERISKANAVVSFNNRPATEAVPYFEQLGPAVNQVMPLIEETPFLSITRDASGNVWKAFIETARTVLQNYDQEALISLTNFADQIPLVINQVAQGMSEFEPTPSENREFFKESYNVPHTLLVKFNVDAIDETDPLEDVLKPRVESIGGTLKKITLSGTHLTPCIQDVTWQVGSQYSPVDALAQGLKSLSLMDTRSLARTISLWFSSIDDLQ